MNITLAGLGVKKCTQLTMECLDTLRNARHCLFLSPDASEFLPFLEQYGVKNVEDIFFLYQDGDVDQYNYDRIYNYIVDSSRQHDEMVLLLPGHPMVGVSVAQMVKSAEGKDFDKVRIQAGISSFDTMIGDLNMDPLEKGSVLVDANRLLLLNLPLSPLMNVFLYHVCSVGTSNTHIHDSSKENRLDQLQNYLLNYYSPDHLLILLHSSTNDGSASTMKQFKLKNLNNMIYNVHIGTTLVIPGRKLKLDDVNAEYMEQLKGTVS